MATTVGTADVVIRALTQQLKDDLRKQFNDAEDQADASGERSGERYSSSFGKGSSGLGGDLEGAFGDLENDADKSGTSGGTRFRNSFRGSVAHVGDDIVQDMERALGDVERVGDDAGSDIGRGIRRGVKDGLDGVEADVAQAGGNIGGTFTKNLSNIDLPDFGSGLALKIAAIIPLVGVLGGGLAALVGALGAVAAAAAFAAGSIAILATGIAGLALGGITAFLAFGGIGKALGALSSQQSKSGATALAASKQQQAAADAIRSATQQLASAQEQAKTAEYDLQQARKSASEEAVQDAHNVAEAEYALAQAQQSEKTAQEDLTQARQEAANKLIDLNLQLRGAIIGQQSAQLSLQQAQQQYAQVISNPASSEQARESAQIQLEQAQLGVDQAIQSKKELAQQDAEAQKKGINGADAVVAARQRETNAVHAVADAEFSLAQARQKQSDDAVTEAHSIQQALLGVKNATQAVANAQHSLAEAQTNAATAGTSGANAVKAAFAGLSPAAIAFTKYLFSLKSDLDKLKTAAGSQLFGPLKLDLKALVNSLFPALLTAVRETSTGLADFFNEVTTALISPQITGGLKALAADFDKIDPKTGLTSWQTFGRIVGNILKGLAGLAQAAFPAFQRFIHFLDDITGKFAGAFDNKAGLTSTTTLINRMADAAAKFGGLFGSLGHLFESFVGGSQKAGQGFVVDMTKSINGLANSLDKTNKLGPKGGLGKYFAEIGPTVHSAVDFIGALAKAFFDLATDPKLGHIFDQLTAALPGLVKAIKEFTDKVAPVMIDVIGKIISAFKTVVSSPVFGVFVTALKDAIDVLGKIFGFADKHESLRLLGDALLAVAGGLAAIAATKKLGDLTGVSYLLNEAKLGKADPALKAVQKSGPIAQLLQGLHGNAIKPQVKGIVKNADGTVKEVTREAEKATLGSRAGIGIRTFLKLDKGQAAKTGEDAAKAAAGPFSKVFSKVGSLFSPSIFSGLSSGAKTAATDVAALAVGEEGATVATEGLTVAATELDVAEDANPIGLVIAALVALGVALVEAYKHSATFRNIIADVGHGLEDFGKILGKVFEDIYNVVKRVITDVIKIYLYPLELEFKVVKAVVTDLWKDGIVPAWDGIKSAISGAWNDVIKPIGGFMQKMFSDVGNAASFLWTKAIKPAWGFITSATKKLWSDVGGFFITGINAVIGFVDKLLGYLNDAIGWLVTIPTIPKISVGGGGGSGKGGTPGHASGAVMGDGFSKIGSGFVTAGPKAIVGEGNAAHPEYVIPTDPAHRNRALSLFSSLGAQLLQGGGKVGAPGSLAGISVGSGTVSGHTGGGGLLGDLKRGASVAAGFARNFAAKGALAALHTLELPLLGIIDAFPLKFARDMGHGIINKVNTAAADLIEGKSASTSGAGSPASNASSGAISAAIQAGLVGTGGGSATGPGHGVFKFRPEATTVARLLGLPASAAQGILEILAHEDGSGDPTAVNRWDSNWQAGHPSVGLAQVIAGTFAEWAGPFRKTGPFSYGVSTNPLANIYAGMNYALHRYGAGMIEAGGLHNAAGQYQGYDAGGFLPPGMSTVLNKTGSPEPVLTGTQWSSLLESIHSSTSDTRIVDQLQAIQNTLQALANADRINIEKFEVQAAPKEPAGSSVPRAMRNLMFELGS